MKKLLIVILFLLFPVISPAASLDFPTSGDVNVGGNLGAAGGVAFSGTTTMTATGDAPVEYYRFHCDATTGDVTFNLHSSASGVAGQIHHFKIITASANDCILDGAASETIDGAATKIFSTLNENITIYEYEGNWLIE